ncbi:MAG: hypothetical protein WCI85_07665 [Comamonadaceae bacterium]
MTTASCHHKAARICGKHPIYLPKYRWLKILLDNLKTSFSCTYNALSLDKCAKL